MAKVRFLKKEEKKMMVMVGMEKCGYFVVSKN